MRCELCHTESQGFLKAASACPLPLLQIDLTFVLAFVFREKPPNHAPLKLISSLKQSNFQNRTE
jgi:hypothetical protein